MSRTALIALIALIAAPALALEEGTYPVSSAQGDGSLVIEAGRVEIRLSGPDACSASGAGALLRGAGGAWAALLGPSPAQCVLIGDAAGFRPLGEGCAELATGSCQLAGSIGSPEPSEVTPARPVRVAASMLEWRFDRLSREDRRSAQRRLTELGLYPGGADGAYGPGTEAGLIGYLQGMADRGEPVDSLSVTFIEEVLARIVLEGRAVTAAASPARQGGAPIYVGRWACSGTIYQFSADSYRMIDQTNGALIAEGPIPAGAHDGVGMYLTVPGVGNVTFYKPGTPDMFVHDPVSAESWDCFPA